MTIERPVEKSRIVGLAAVAMAALALTGALSGLGVASGHARPMVRETPDGVVLYDPLSGRLEWRTGDSMWRVHRVGRAAVERMLADPHPAATVREWMLYRLPSERCTGGEALGSTL